MNKYFMTLLITATTSMALVVGCSDNQHTTDPHAGHDMQSAPKEQDHSSMQHDPSTMEQNMGSKTTSADGAKPYPIDTCIVSGEKLGSMGDPVRIVHQGQEIKFCCKNCVKDFQADPQKYLAALAQKAAAAHSK